MKIISKFFVLLLTMLSVVFCKPMEPAKSTLFILLDGMNPSNKGLLQNFCDHYEDGEAWGKTGVAKYLQENIANTKANIYSRPYKNPAEAPSSMISELVGRGNSVETVSCLEKKSVYDASAKGFSYQTDSKMQLSSIVDEALKHWFADVLYETEMILPAKSSQRVSAQKDRNAWAWDDSKKVFLPRQDYSASFANIDPFLYAWLKNYKKQNGKMPTLENLKDARPDLLPSRYVFVANGMGGMLAREYIQSSDYNGDVDKILFVDTPHEGTGFADQALLSKDGDFMKRDISTSFIMATIPLVTLLYSSTDSKTIEKFYVPLIKNIMTFIAGTSNFAASIKMNESYFGSYSEKDGALWYLSQDADKRDLIYNYIRGEANSVGADTLIGRTQMLNSYGMLSSYDNPMYRIIYSYGMPTIGNGRRTRVDYPFQKKYHVDEKVMIKQMCTVFKNAFSEILLDSLKLEQKIARRLILKIEDFLDDQIRTVTHWKQMFDFEGREITGLEGMIFDALDDIDTRKIAESAAKAAFNKGIEFAVDYGVGALLELIDIGGIIDAMPEWLVTFISAIAELAPQQLTEQFVAAFMGSYAPSYGGMDKASNNCKLGDFSTNPLDIGANIDLFNKIDDATDDKVFNYGNCVSAGHKDFAQRLINYSVNFYDEGTSDVPSYSAFGGNVALFSNSDVKRKSYPLHTMKVGPNYSDYTTFKANLLVGGAVESNRQLIDEVLGPVCDILPSTYGMVCKTAQLLVNTGIIVGQNVQTSYLFHSVDVLKKSAELSLKSSVQNSKNGSVKLHGGSRSFTYTDMDMLMFEKPYMSMQMVLDQSNENNKYIPLMLNDVSGSGHEIPEIVDFKSLEQVYRQKYIKNNGSDEGFEIGSVFDFSGKIDGLKEKKLTTSEDYYSLSLRHDSYKKNKDGVVTRRISRYSLPDIVVDHFVEEYRFQIEDLRPDLLWSIAFDFNMDVQFYFERNQNNTWNTYVERNGGNRIMIEEGGESPVDEMGLFVFRPFRLVEQANAKVTDANKKIFPNKVQPEGPNLVSVSLTNAMGLVSSQQFSFYFQATLPLLKEGWPTYLQTVSSLKDIYITASNLDDPYEFTHAEACLVKSKNGVYTPALNDCVVGKIIPQSASEWTMEAHFDDALVGALENGEYIIQWKLVAKSIGENTNSTPYNMNVSVILDTRKPELQLSVPEDKISNKIKDGTWAKIINTDNSSLRATRIFAIPANSKDTVWIKTIYGTGMSEINVGWNYDMEKLPQGNSTIYVQSIDYAEPNIEMGLILQKLYSEDSKVANEAWQSLLKDDGVSFKSGINGITLTKSIYIDSEDPSVDENSVNVVAVQSATPCSDCPDWTRLSGEETIVNSSESVQLSFKLKGKTSSAVQDNVRIQVLFIDTAQSLVKSYVVSHDFKDKSIFTFVEPTSTRLLDGKYLVKVILTDAAGNSSGEVDLGKVVRVARTIPVVNSVLTAEPVYASAADVDAASFTVSSSEIDVNKSSFACYQRLIARDGASNWMFVGDVSADKMVDGKKVSVDYSIKNASANIKNGRYSAEVGCFDGAGNFSSNSVPFSVGFRYPVLSYPTAVDGEISYDIIRISGIAPNPIVPEGNIQTAEYKVEWRPVGSTEWKTDGIQSTGKLVSTLVNNLAVWNRKGVPAGTYELRLSVRGCLDERDSKCDWIHSDVETIRLLDIANQDKPSIRLIASPIQGLVPGEENAGLITSELLGVNDGSEWSMDMKIYVSDPYDASRMIVADQMYLDRMIISPFGGSDGGVLPQGVSIWQEGDEWTIKVHDVLEANKLHETPKLTMHYIHSGLEFVNAVKPDEESFYNVDDPTQMAPEVNVGSAVKPAYNYTSTWNLEGKKEFEVKFKASESFIVDLSSVKDVNDKLYCGTSGILCSNYFPMLLSSNLDKRLSDYAFSEVYVNVNSFKVFFPWNGLTTGGMYPSSSKVKIVAVATETYPGARVATKEVEMNLAMSAPKIISTYPDDAVGQFVISSNTNGKNEFLRLGEISYEFGVAGRNANVTVTVKNSNNDVLTTLMNNKLCIASAKKNSQIVSWDGISDHNFAKIDAGRYFFEVTAIDDDGHTVTKKYPFDIVHANHLIAAPDGASSSAELLMEEAEKDDNGDYRFVGRADYNLTMDVNARVLPKEKRTFEYYWDWKGMQNPAFYRANRFSLGIRRQRKSFPVTLVTRLNSRQYYINSNFNLRKRCLKNRVRVQQVTFDKDIGFVEIPRLSVASGDNTDHIIGWNEDGNAEYDINFEAKVFDISDYENIKQQLGDTAVSYCESWNSDLKEYTADEKTKKFDENFPSTTHVNKKLWSYKKTFWYKSKSPLVTLDGAKEAVTEGCTPSEDNGYECKESDSFNPHKNMLLVSIEHIDGKSYYGNNDFDCDYLLKCTNHESATELYAKVTFTVNDKYWNPEFGYSNLANKYVRFDHTNKTLYDATRGYYAQADANTSMINYYDGEQWTYNKYYGMVTPFEVQRFFFNGSDMAEGNPLTFPDEIENGNIKLPLTPSLYWFGFKGVDHEDRYDESKYGKKVDFIATAIGTLNGTPVARVITSNDGDASVVESVAKGVWLDAPIDFYVTAHVPMKSASYQRNERVVAFPYDEKKYVPSDFGSDALCDITKDMSKFDDQSIHCFMYYHAASRIHYGKNDWTDDQWLAHFASPTYVDYFNNPMYATPMNPRLSSGLLGKLSQAWGNSVRDAVYLTSEEKNLFFEDGVWKLDMSSIEETFELSSVFDNSLQPQLHRELVLSQESRNNGWNLNNAGVAVNEGVDEKISAKYTRANDSHHIDYNSLKVGSSEIIEKEQIADQNKSIVFEENDFVQKYKLSNLMIFDRNNEEHSFFTAKLSEDAQKVVVSRNEKVPVSRVSEIATLLGRVPSNANHWSLSFLSGSRMIPIASSETLGNESKGDYNVVRKIDVDTLQGNTSFFLTYGLNDAAGDVYYKQLDVHIGELIDPNDEHLVQSMYGNVSVQFPAKSFDSQTDVTVRVASLSDYDYSVFDGLLPVGSIVEVLPSHVFNQDNRDLWPRVSIEITKTSLGLQNPLDVKIYKPDFKNKTIVPLENQEIGFYTAAGDPVYTCKESSEVDCVKPDNDKWDVIRVSGKTSTFSVFMLMDENQAALVKPSDGSSDISDFACEEGASYIDVTLWAGLVNGYLSYPYPCVGESNYMLQLLKDGSAIAEYQGLANSKIIWDVRKNDLQSKITYKDALESRLSLYGNNGKKLQIAGPVVYADESLPVIEEASVNVDDYELQKRVSVNALLSDSESGIDSVKMDFIWAGKKIETRVRTNVTTITEDLLLTKKMVGECVGCKLEVDMTIYDYGHNHVKTVLYSENIYPFPKSLVLWYPLADGAGVVAKEAIGSGIDFNLSMNSPWSYGSSLYFSKINDVAKPNKTWNGIGLVPMSIEFKLRSSVSRIGKEFSVLGWNGPEKWLVGLKDVNNLFFEYNGQRILFNNAQVKRGVEIHYVLTINGRNIRLYRDGSLVEEKKLSDGFVWNTMGRPILGSIDDYKSINARLSNVRFYKTDLTDEEILDLYRGHVDVVDANIVVVRAVDLSERNNLTVDQSCDLAGMAYLRQKSPEMSGSVTWNLYTVSGQYDLFILARGYTNLTSAVEIVVDGSSRGSFNIDGSGVWLSQAIEGLSLNLSTGEHYITVKPIGYAGVAALAVANAENDVPASMISWNEGDWTIPDPKVQVEVAYPAYSDKSWLRVNFRLKNLSDKSLDGAKLRYYYSGEDYFVSARSFYPNVNMGVYADAGDVFYTELQLTETIPVGGYPYYRNGPQIGAYRINDNAPWNFDDDPSFESKAVNGDFQVTDKIAVLDEDGNLISKFNCYDGSGPAKVKTPSVRALALDEKGTASDASSISITVENVGEIPVHGFEVRYFIRDTEKPELDVYNNSFAESVELVDVGDDLYYVSFKYDDVILNPGEKSDYGTGVKFALHHSDWQRWNATDDASHFGLSYEFAQADSVVVLDYKGNLLWGGVPQSVNALPEIAGDDVYGNLIVISSDKIFVSVPSTGKYVLERVNAAGFVQNVLYSGTWGTGEHVVAVEKTDLISGQYLVLRSETKILSRIMIK